jgi:cobalt/nickel transport system permease protein
MHIPDGFLATPVWFALDAVSLPAIGFAARRARRELEETRVPLLGVMGAFVFAAQMVNFPVGAGTSGHLMGGALLAITLGPAAAAIVMTAILSVQAFIFQDGGVLALGANILNMAFAGVIVGYLPYYFWGRRRLAIFAGGAFSVLTSALLAVAELLISGVPMPRPMLLASAGLFVVNAALEGAITVAVVQGIEALNPGFIRRPVAVRRLALAVVSLAAVLLATLGAVVASMHPDTLEKIVERLGGSALSLSWPQKTAAGLGGLAVISCVCLLVGRFMARQRSA